MMNLSEYVKKTSEEIDKNGGDPDAVFNSSVSDAMISCHNIACAYAQQRKIKNPPIPINVTSKSSEAESCTRIKFSTNVNAESLRQAVTKVGAENINITEYDSSINVEIYHNSEV